MEVNALGLPIFSKSKRIKTKTRERKFYNLSFNFSFKKDSPKDLIVMYDIPSTLKKERDWFRRHLKKFQYIMIQKSVWVGPSPLPKEFLDYVKEIKIEEGLKTFKLAKPYSDKSNNI